MKNLKPLDESTDTTSPSARRWQRIKADPALLARERERIRALYAKSEARRDRQRETGAAWRAAHPQYMRRYYQRQRSSPAIH